MSLYVGVNGINKNVCDLYVGVNGVRKAVSELYVGDENNKPKLVYSSVNVDTDIVKVNPTKLLVSGKITSEDIGKTVYISNSKSACQEWIIAGVNHDGTDRSVDLISKYALIESVSFSPTNHYRGSDLRAWLNRNLMEGFSKEIRDILSSIRYKSTIFDSNSTYMITMNDYVVPPSPTELCLKDYSYGTTNEPSTMYPLFGSSITSNTNPLAIMCNISNKAVRYFTRCVNLNDTDYTITVNTNGEISTIWTPYKAAAVGIIRFAPKVDGNTVSIEEELAKVDPIELLVSGRLTKEYIGRTVYLSNCEAYSQEWLIADIDHDKWGNYNIDLISKYIYKNRIMFNSAYSTNDGTYAASGIRYIMCSSLNGFSDTVREYMCKLPVTEGDITINDFVKCPSFTEVGITNSYTDGEGSVYPVFGDKAIGTNEKAIRTYKDTNTDYWVRSAPGTLSAHTVNIYGNLSFDSYTDDNNTSTYNGSVAIIRLGKRDSSLSIEDQLKMIDPIEALTSGNINSTHIGQIVHIYNSTTTCTEWMIADINHDGTSGTIDLMANNCLSMADYNNTDSDLCNYKTSGLREYLNGKFYDGFSTRMKSIMIDTECGYNGEILHDKVKIPSLSEFGYALTDYDTASGNYYPIFNTSDKNSYVRKMFNYVAKPYWTRNTYNGSGGYTAAVYIGSDGSVLIDYFNGNSPACYIVPIIRIKINN